jgi:hypothetical protein
MLVSPHFQIPNTQSLLSSSHTLAQPLSTVFYMARLLPLLAGAEFLRRLAAVMPLEVDPDEKRQECFLEGLIRPLNYQLQSHSFPNFQTLLNKAIGLESKIKELFGHKGNSKDSPARTLDRTTRKVLSFALKIRVEIVIIKYNTLDNKDRETTKTIRRTTLRPVIGLVGTNRIIKEAP